MVNLPKDVKNFSLWWVLKAPRKIFETCKRVFILTNNELSLTLNIRNFFVPLFGDYTWVGRMMGFVYRVIKIVIGVPILVLILVASVLFLVSWYALPFVLVHVIGFWFIPYTLVLFVVWRVVTHNMPDKRVSQVDKSNSIDSFRPEAGRFVRLFSVTGDDYTLVISNLVSTGRIQNLLKKLEVLNEGFVNEFTHAVYLGLDELQQKSYEFASEQESRYVELEHVFLALLSCIDKLDIFLSKFDLTFDDCKGCADWIVGRREELSKVFFWQEDYNVPSMGGVNRAMTGRVTPFLDSVSDDLTEQARRGYIKDVIGREEEMKEISNILGSSGTENVLIIGEPGCGKSAIVRGLAYKIIRGTEYKPLRFKRLVRLDAGLLVAGTKTSGDIAAKVKKVMEDAEGSGDIILFLDEIHNLVVSSSGNPDEPSSIFSILEPYLASGRLQVIGATNVSNYRKYLEPVGSFSRLFQIVEIEESSKKDTIEILKVIGRSFEGVYKITISYPSLIKAVELSEKLIHERVLPDKAIDILNRTAIRVSQTTKLLTQEEVAKTVSEMTHVPVTAVEEDESKKLLNIETEMKKYVIGQNEAIDQIGKAIKRARVGMRDVNRPISSFLFVGTTGVGKTETAKTLARTYFGSEDVMIRLDMSEYQQPDSINRLIGKPDGSSKGLLTEAVRSAPFALVLLDEIEKAHPDILLAFLQVLDDGRLTDSTGRVIDFTNTIIIATSNVGTREIQEVSSRKGSFEEISNAAMNEVRKRFAPEFLNRFTDVVVFRPLETDTVREIAKLMLNRVKNSADEKGVKLSFRTELIEELVKRGYNPEWGARPLARVIEDSVETYIAERMLAKEIQRGSEVTLGIEVFEG